MNRIFFKLLRRSVPMLCFVLLASCSDGEEYVLTAEIAGGGMTAAIPAEGGYVDVDIISNLPSIAMEISQSGTSWLRWPMDDISLETISVSDDMRTVRITLIANPRSNSRLIHIRFANEKRTLVSGTITLTQDALPES